MSLVDALDVPFLRLSDSSFSIRSPEVRAARERSWYARTPYGIAVLRYEDVGKLLRDPRLRQGSHAWPAHNNVTGTFADWWLRILLNRVGDDHARLRRLANRNSSSGCGRNSPNSPTTSSTSSPEAAAATSWQNSPNRT
jgi:hypothetical protein